MQFFKVGWGVVAIFKYEIDDLSFGSRKYFALFHECEDATRFFVDNIILLHLNLIYGVIYK